MNDEKSIPISVCMITYNHEKYIGQAIESVLNQSFSNFEFIIVNDGSSDRTDEIILTYHDPRISYVSQLNQGPSTAFNQAIRRAKGTYIALMSGDDISHPERLAIQYAYLEKHQAKITFSQADFIDSDSQRLLNPTLYDLIIQLQFNTQEEMINQFFFNGNYLCAGTCMVLRELIVEKGMFNPALIQLQDYALWCKIALSTPLIVLPEKLLKYRIRADQGNLSHTNNQARGIFEYVEVHRMMLNETSIPAFKEAFQASLIRPEFSDEISFAFEKAFLFLKHRLTLVQYIGLQNLFVLMQDEAMVKHAVEFYNFNLPKLYNLILEQNWLPEFYNTDPKAYIYAQLRAKRTRVIQEILSPVKKALRKSIRCLGF